ncbi:adipokinetic hormone/corazonin-related peptide receptor variant I-like [Microplitis mediator]|uniref:adipokinetic hormone/corazonin-related peptide receptor variant I-like n=1 Tax=Microplitis mediator TaxID=375433 RepID=UPI0025544271|nr:adipokinetic hormone/corazonin-related peptide receptor variant I-like [Microplitis mediator]XP_057341368.1 adipokinetic hormone/corazonin-related peptide receptor variant I-like [Microplitis mediator]
MSNSNETKSVSDLMSELPIDMQFNEGHLLSIVTYSILMVISIAGNTTVLVLIIERRKTNQSRINTMLLHLAIADLLVTLLMMPLEIGWAATVSWRAGDLMCRIMAFFRVFGIYLSSFVLVCISIDRYYAVLKPMQLINIDRREKLMLIGAWIGAVLCSAPQMLVFHVQRHPDFPWYEQCITYHFLFSNVTQEVGYSVFSMIMMYCFPLVVIIYTYTSILIEIHSKTRENSKDKIRRSSIGFLGRARIRTLKMTIIIVAVFFICWTPYYIISIWYWIDRDSASKLDQKIQKGLFLFACTNSCMNPIVYGAFNIRRNTHRTVRASTLETRITPFTLSVKLIDTK